MPFEKGHEKFGGREKGSANKKNALRDQIEWILNKPIPTRLMELVKSTPQREFELLMGLLPYCYPKLQSTTITDGNTAEAEDKQAEIIKLRQQLLDAKTGE